jgi:hypothetical protein
MGSVGWGPLQARLMAPTPGGPDPIGSDSPMLTLVSAILVLGGIGLLIAWGLSHAYPA